MKRNMNKATVTHTWCIFEGNVDTTRLKLAMVMFVSGFGIAMPGVHGKKRIQAPLHYDP